MSYHVGDLIKLTAEFTNASGALVDPTSVVITIRVPSTGEVLLPSVTKASTGIYTCSQLATESGDWKWRAVGTGAVQGANQGQITVEPLDF
jgi:hypothetical protein